MLWCRTDAGRPKGNTILLGRWVSTDFHEKPRGGDIERKGDPGQTARGLGDELIDVATLTLR